MKIVSSLAALIALLFESSKRKFSEWTVHGAQGVQSELEIGYAMKRHSGQAETRNQSYPTGGWSVR